MKNVLVVLTFMLMSSLAFASSGAKAETNSAADVKIENVVKVVEIYSYSDNQSAEAVDCTITGKFTVTNARGEKVTWEGTLTIVGVSCSQFLKEMMAQ